MITEIMQPKDPVCQLEKARHWSSELLGRKFRSFFSSILSSFSGYSPNSTFHMHPCTPPDAYMFIFILVSTGDAESTLVEYLIQWDLTPAV